MTPVERATALIRKAMGTDSEDEARTCAFLAIKIVVKENLQLISPTVLDSLRVAAETRQAAAVRDALAQERARRARSRRPADAPSRTSFASACLFCEKELNPGDKVFYSKIFEVMCCPDCFEAEILVNRRVGDMGKETT